MNKLIILLLILIAMLVSSILLFSTKNNSAFAEIDGKRFDIDIAKTNASRDKGLAIYDKLPINRGMLFIFENSGQWSFWMKDMKFPIDIIFINDGKIIDVFKKVPPPTSINQQLPIYTPKSPANMVLEINSGLFDKYRFKIGNYVKVNY